MVLWLPSLAATLEVRGYNPAQEEIFYNNFHHFVSVLGHSRGDFKFQNMKI